MCSVELKEPLHDSGSPGREFEVTGTSDPRADLLTPSSPPNHPFNCAACGSSFSIEKHRLKHIKKNKDCAILLERPNCANKPFSRDHCEASFASAAEKCINLKSDMATSSEDQCSTNNSSVSQIVTQRKVGEPFECSTCGSTFSQKGNLKRHMTTHSQVRDKPFQCSTCGKAFAFKHVLKEHMRIHSGDSETFECSTCGKGFSRKGHLEAHMVTHRGEKPYDCSICWKRFRHRISLRKHMAVAHGEKGHFERK